MRGMAGEGEQPFGVVLKRLRKERKLSLEALAYATRDADPERQGVSFGGVGHLERGAHQPQLRTMELIAAALGVEPELFAEYRLAMARQALDERQVGLDRALANLRALRSDADDDGAGVLPAPPERLDRELRSAPPKRRDPGQARSAGAGRRRSRP